MLPIKSWKIIYADESEFTSEDGTWAEAPPFGVQCVVYYHVPEPYKTIDGGRDNGNIYLYFGERIHPDYQGIKMGLWMDRDGAYRIQDLATASTAPEVN
jgi:hypothetical protein